MQQMSVPALRVPDRASNLSDLVVDNAAQAPDAIVFSRPTSDGWADVSCAAFLEEVTRLARGLVAAGVQPGDRVGLMSKTRYEWTLVDFAIWFVGAVTVPIYETSSAEQVPWILSDSGAVACFVETERARRRPSPRSATGCPPCARCGPSTPARWTRWRAAGAGRGRRRDRAPPTRWPTAATVATIIYTSGTTGRPKGCELTHANFADLAAQRDGPARGGGRRRRGLAPCCSCRWRTSSPAFIQVLCVAARVRMGHSADVTNLLPDLADFRPTFLLAVPRVFEKIYNSAEAKAQAGGKGGSSPRPPRPPIAGARRRTPGGAGLALRLRYAGVRPAGLLQAARQRWAARCSTRSPAAPRSAPGSGTSSAASGVTILEGYGLTETTAPATVNTPDRIKIGTVGRPLPGVASRSPTTARCWSGGRTCSRATANNPEATRGGAGATAGSTPATSASSTTDGFRPDHRPQEGDHRHRGRQERRPGGAGGPAPRAPAGFASAWSSATSGRSSPAWSPSTRRCSRCG